MTDKQNVKFGIETQQNTQLNEEQLNEIAHLVAVCALTMHKKSDVYDYLEKEASSKRIAIIAAMYIGYRMQDS